MEQKYYVPQQGLHCLTLATHPGMLTEQDIVANLVRMSLMDDGMSAEEAMEEMLPKPVQPLNKLEENAMWEYNSPEFQDYLTRKNLLPSKSNDSLKLVPITEAMKEEGESQITEEEALSRMWEILDEFNLETFQTQELPTVEWD